MAAVKDKVVGVRRVPRISEEEYRTKLGLKSLTDDGKSVLSPVPMDPPVGYIKQPSIFENMRSMVRAELDRQAKDQGFETADEAEDFNIGEDRDPLSKHEFTEMDEEFVTSTATNYNNAIVSAKKQKAAQAAMPASSPEGGQAGQGPAEPAREALDAPRPSGTPKK